MKTALIFTGGTIGSEVCGGYISPGRVNGHDLLDGYDTEAFDIIKPYTILSENLTFSHINTLLKCIDENINTHDGVIVMHGTDTLQYSAAAVSYAFGLDSAPIMLVSSNYILSDPRANGRDNFRCALDFIKNGHGRGTFISYKNAGEYTKIHRASRALSYAPYSDCIESLCGEFGHYENGQFIKNGEYAELQDETKPFGAITLTPRRLLKLSAMPDIPSDMLDNAEAVLLETYHSGTADEQLIKNLTCRIFIIGASDGIQYESTRAYERENVTILKKCTPPAAYIKLHMAFSSHRLGDINKSIGGDIQ